ncbi:YueI family protein [Virgibacillus senegalensis]|uniref:YueI family protein n=1 Tax=Virgibacillus senegalensis TaxID=1499679 RepID=UPI00069CBED7|nr:YueI family protein [Virgibacillus senegalensis]
MSKRNMEDYLEEGLYGAKQTKPAERKKYLGTLRERILLALKKSQVMQQQGFAELEAEMKAHPNAKLLLNGKINSRFFKAYKKLAKQHNIAYTSVTNNEADTDIGAVLTSNSAVDRESIFVEEKEQQSASQQKDTPQGVKARFKKWFGL